MKMTENAVSLVNSRNDLSNEDKIRFLIMEEILISEKQYCEVLGFLCNKIKSDLVQCSNLLEYEISECQIRTLLSNIDDVHTTHQHFYTLLQEIVQSNNEDPNAKMGAVFMSMQERFKSYDQYISNFMKTQITLAEVKNMATMQPVYEKWRTESPLPPVRHNGKSILEVYLKEPLQRLCRYVVFLKELSAFTSIDHDDFDDVIKSHYYLQKSASAIGKVLRTDFYTFAFEECAKESDVREQVGLTCKQGFLTKRGGNVKDDKALSCIDLTHCKSILVNAENTQRPNCFGIVLPDRTYVMYATNEVEKMTWVCAIAWRLFCQLSPQMKAGRCLALASEHATPIDLLMVNDSTPKGEDQSD